MDISSETPQEFTPEPQLQQPIEQQPIEPQPFPEDQLPVADNKKSKTPLIIVIVVLLLLAGGAVAFFLFKDQLFGGQRNASDNERITPPVAEMQIGGNALTDFDLTFLKKNNEEANKLYSPLSIKIALKMLSDGAKGETKAEIDKLVGGDYKAKPYLNSKNLSLANGLFVRTDKKANILDSYLTGIQKNYAAEIIYDDFTNANNFNKWVSSKTLGLITKMLDDSDVSSVNYILVNALAIDMSWNYSIQCAQGTGEAKNKSYEAVFAHEKYDADIECLESSNFDKIKFGNSKTEVDVAKIGASFNRYDIVKELGRDKIRSTIQAKYAEWAKDNPYVSSTMSDNEVDKFISELDANYGKVVDSTDFKMYYDDDVQAFAKNLKTYDGTTLQYVGIMPKKQSLKNYIANSSAKDVASVVAKLYDVKKEYYKPGVVTKVEGSIPFFKYDYELKLRDNLQELGVEKVFSPETADLSGITKEEGAYVSDVKHKATIDFSNDGIKAAAVTSMSMDTAGIGDYEFEYLFDVPVETVDLTFNQPYMYLIRDVETGEIWFTGTVYEPSADADIKVSNYLRDYLNSGRSRVCRYGSDVE